MKAKQKLYVSSASFGAVAQLEAHQICILRVEGSTPSGSTTEILTAIQKHIPVKNTKLNGSRLSVCSGVRSTRLALGASVPQGHRWFESSQTD